MMRSLWEFWSEPVNLDLGGLLGGRWARQSLAALAILVLYLGIHRLAFLPVLDNLDYAMTKAASADYDFAAAARELRGLEAWRWFNLASLVERLRSPLSTGIVARDKNHPRDSTLVQQGSAQGSAQGSDSAAASQPVDRTALLVFSRLPVDDPAAQLGAGFDWSENPVTKERRLHQGLDFLAPEGAPVRAVADGTVAGTGEDREYGRWVLVDHGKAVATYYAQNSQILVKTGQAVKVGDQLAKAGKTGVAAASHLHFEVRLNGKAVDPRPFLPLKGGS